MSEKSITVKESRLERLRREVALLPRLPGIYKFFDRTGKVIYVGKAKELRRRVWSYFANGSQHSPKTRLLVSNIESLEHIVVGSEQDALLLENNLIKTFQPRYNTLLKDDKTYPWIVVRREDFPRIESTRRLSSDGSTYFGPYASLGMQHTLLELIHTLYPIRTCKLNLSPEAIARGKYTVCLQYHIGNCKGMCVGAQSEQDYKQYIDMSKAILKGDLRSARTYLNEAMHGAAAELNFELAESLRKRLVQFDTYASKSVIVSSKDNDIDVVSILIESDEAYCNFTRIASGCVVSSFCLELAVGAEQQREDVLTSAIAAIASRLPEGLGKEVLVPFVPHTELFEGVKFTVPQRGDRAKLMEFSGKSIKFFRMEKLKNMEIKDPERHTKRVLETLRKAMHLAVEPRHIECFDNSNLQGTNAVAACVVFRDCKPSKKEYRHFNVKTVIGADDFATMREIITRRYTRLVAEGQELPNLIIVDGGKGQLSSAYAALQDIGLENKIPIVGLAKRIEEIFFPHDPEPYYLERGSEALRVVMHIRDEAHRFGITFHRQKRSKAFIKSSLTDIEGIGEGTSEKLMKHFKSLSKIKQATLEQIAEVVGQSKAKVLRDGLDKS